MLVNLKWSSIKRAPTDRNTYTVHILCASHLEWGICVKIILFSWFFFPSGSPFSKTVSDLTGSVGFLRQFKNNISSVLSLLYGPMLIAKQLLEKTIALSILTFLSKMMYLLFNTLSSFPSKEQESFNFMAAVTVKPEKIKSVTASNFSPSVCYKVMGPDAMTLVFFNVEFQASLYTKEFTIISTCQITNIYLLHTPKS